LRSLANSASYVAFADVAVGAESSPDTN
jgi:hypothetical protein